MSSRLTSLAILVPKFTTPPKIPPAKAPHAPPTDKPFLAP